MFKDQTITKSEIIFPCGMSRSGTTLLTTVLDTHPKISLGYELMPAEILNIADLIQSLETLQREYPNNSLEQHAKTLKRNNSTNEGLLSLRAARTGLSTEVFKSILTKWLDKSNSIKSVEERFKISYDIVKEKSKEEGSAITGFKLNNASYDLALRLFPNSYYIYILRDPRDVWVSHVKRKFKRTSADVCNAWNNYIQKFITFKKLNPSRAAIIKYEDLVRSPRETLTPIFNTLPVDHDDTIYNFYKSNASVHESSHPNSDQLSQNFFTSSIGSWKSYITPKDRDAIEAMCSSLMSDFDYV